MTSPGGCDWSMPKFTSPAMHSEQEQQMSAFPENYGTTEWTKWTAAVQMLASWLLCRNAFDCSAFNLITRSERPVSWRTSRICTHSAIHRTPKSLDQVVPACSVPKHKSMIDSSFDSQRRRTGAASVTPDYASPQSIWRLELRCGARTRTLCSTTMSSRLRTPKSPTMVTPVSLFPDSHVGHLFAKEFSPIVFSSRFLTSCSPNRRGSTVQCADGRRWLAEQIRTRPDAFPLGIGAHHRWTAVSAGAAYGAPRQPVRVAERGFGVKDGRGCHRCLVPRVHEGQCGPRQHPQWPARGGRGGRKKCDDPEDPSSWCPAANEHVHVLPLRGLPDHPNMCRICHLDCIYS